MDNLCHRCNAEVAPGIPFCPQCGAPQIRVATPVTSQPVVSRVDEELGTARFVGSSSDSGEAISAIRWSSALPKTAVSGFATVALLILIASITQLPALALLVVPFGGAFSVLLYVRGNNKQPVSAGAGARLGAVTGLFSFAVYCLIAAAELSSQRGEVLNTVRKALEEAAAKNPNPQAQTVVQQMMTPAGIAILLVLAAIIFLFTFLILSSLGGAAGAAMLKSGRPESD
ncbi:MAG: hypothetical protein JWN45_3335 [Acidobacteriaceae bacterium]|nr:hypothetical protein [Acidobacteriaceae bacterium]